MKRPSFLEGVWVALVAAVLAAVVAGVLPTMFAQEQVTRGLIAGLGLGYVLYLLSRSRKRVGRVTTLLAWLSVAAAGWFLLGTLASYFALHLGMAWVARSLHHQPGPLAAALDLGLNLVASVSAAWAFLHTGSVFLGVWTFFLIQALFVAIPTMTSKFRSASPGPEAPSDRFEEARRNAEDALRRLAR